MKKNIKIILTSLLGLIAITACQPTRNLPEQTQTDNETTVCEETSAERQDNPYDYTLLIYMCGNNLESKNGAATKNIAEMLSASFDEGINVIIQTGGTKAWRNYDIPNDQSCRYRIENGELVLIESANTVNMGQASSLKDFLVWGEENYCADKMSVILWDHGGGALKGVCYDEQYNNDALTLSELRESFENARKITNRVYDFVGFDACLMANYETAVIMSSYAEHMIASEELEPVGGWDYACLCQNLGKDDFFEAVLRGYKDKCEANDKNAFTLSHIDLTKFGAVEEIFDRLVDEMQRRAADNRLIDIVHCATYSMKFGGNSASEGYTDIIDLSDLAFCLEVKEIPAEIMHCVDVVSGQEKADARGLSIFYPLHNNEKVEDYLSVAASEAYGDFLDKYYTDVDSEQFITTESIAIRDGSETCVKLTNASLKYLNYMSYRVYMTYSDVNTGEDHTIFIGEDTDFVDEGDGRYVTHFGGRWVEWNGSIVHMEPVDAGYNRYIFATTAEVNGESGTIRFYYDYDNKQFFLMGFVTTFDGMVDRYGQIEEGSTITLKYQEKLANNLVWLKGESFTYTAGSIPLVQYLPEGNYQIEMIANDIFGNQCLLGTSTVYFLEGKTEVISVN